MQSKLQIYSYFGHTFVLSFTLRLTNYSVLIF